MRLWESIPSHDTIGDFEVVTNDVHKKGNVPIAIATGETCHPTPGLTGIAPEGKTENEKKDESVMTTQRSSRNPTNERPVMEDNTNREFGPEDGSLGIRAPPSLSGGADWASEKGEAEDDSDSLNEEATAPCQAHGTQ